MNAELLNSLNTFFSAAANANRLRILYALSQTEERRVSDLADDLGISLPATSSHLKILRQANLVKFRREALTNYYSINKDNGFVSFLLRLFEEPKE